MDREILEACQGLTSAGEEGVLAVVVEAAGSVPRGAGAWMLVSARGNVGSVGGGALEKRILDEVPAVLASGEPNLLSFNLGRDLGMNCGGTVSVYLEPLLPAGRLVIFGGGHIGLALHKLTPLLGLQAVIVDERSEYAAGQRFPGARTICDLPAVAARQLAVGERDSVVVVTHQHRHDLEAVRAVIEARPAYLGMIGSRTKVKKTRDALLADGVPPELLEDLRAPVGLDLGGRTPGEIAVAVAAEIIALRSGRRIPADFSW
jgi:xanthine dehydrogenase accessory factor